MGSPRPKWQSRTVPGSLRLTEFIVLFNSFQVGYVFVVLFARYILCFCFIAHMMDVNAAPWENPMIPSNGPDSLNVFSTRAKLSSKPKQESLGIVALNSCSFVLNHQPYI